MLGSLFDSLIGRRSSSEGEVGAAQERPASGAAGGGLGGLLSSGIGMLGEGLGGGAGSILSSAGSVANQLLGGGGGIGDVAQRGMGMLGEEVGESGGVGGLASRAWNWLSDLF